MGVQHTFQEAQAEAKPMRDMVAKKKVENCIVASVVCGSGVDWLMD